MSKLKIAFLSYRSDPFSGGQGIYLKNLCEALVKRNHDITIFSGSPLPDVPKNIRLIKVETPGYFETFSFRERLLSLRVKSIFPLKLFILADTDLI